MKIAIASDSNDPAAEISHQGARALFYLIFGDDGHLSEIIENPYVGNEIHVGLDVANMLVKMHVTIVVAGRFGPKFKQGLENSNVQCIEETGFAAQVVKNILD